MGSKKGCFIDTFPRRSPSAWRPGGEGADFKNVKWLDTQGVRSDRAPKTQQTQNRVSSSGPPEAWITLSTVIKDKTMNFRMVLLGW